MHDAITLEKRKVPAALVCTDQFIVTAKAMAKIQGLPEYPFAVVPHPMGSLTQDNTHRRAEEALPQVIELLLGNGK